MNERLIENWLTRTTERAFVVPFCQLLVALGYKILWVSPHNLNEAGKDVIAEKAGEISCFQLKDETINLPFFLKIESELRELITHPIVHPSIDIHKPYKSYLVTTKTVNDPVPSRIAVKNQDNWGQQKEAKLEYWDKGYLLPLFVEHFGSFFPKDPITFQGEIDSFFRLYFSDGTSALPKKDIANFFESFLSVYSEQHPSKNELGTSISALMLLTSYVLTPWSKSKNYIAQIEGWVMLQAYIYASVNKNQLPRKYWKGAIEVIDLEVDRLLEQLFSEVKARKHLIEGDWFTEPAVYGARVSIILGYLSSFIFRKLVSGQNVDTQLIDDIKKIFQRYLLTQRLYGEAYLPLFIFTTFMLRKLKMEQEAFTFMHVMLTALVDKKHQVEPLGLPNPYYDFEETLEIRHGYRSDVTESFKGKSFFLESIVELIARANQRRGLEIYWNKISHIQNCEFIPENAWEFFIYRAKNGENQDKYLPKQESWKKLSDKATQMTNLNLPEELIKDKKFAVVMALVFPHRATSSLIKLIDISTSST